MQEIEQIAEKTSKDRLLNIIYDLSELENTIKWSTQKTIMFQTGIIKLCMETKSSSIEDLNDRISRLEQAIRTGITVNQASRQTVSTNRAQPGTIVAENKSGGMQNSVAKPNAIQNSASDGKLNWPAIINEFRANGKIMIYTNLLNTNAKEINDMTVGIEFPNGITPFGKAVLEKSENINEIEKQVSIICGKEMRVKFIDTKQQDNNQSNNANSIEALAKDLDVPFNIIEE